MLLACSHWIWSPSGDVPTIAGSHRLEDLTSLLPPQDSAPSLVLMIGCRRRPVTCRRSRRQSAGICLDLHDDDEYPILVGTAVLHKQYKTELSCCGATRETSPPACASESQINAAIYSQLLYPFVDVFCFYAYGAEDLACIANHLAMLIQVGRPIPRLSNPPTVLLVLAGNQWVQNQETTTQAFTDLLGNAAPPNHYFSHVSFMHLPDVSRRGTIPPFLVDHSRRVRQQRRKASMLFSVRHLNTLFDRAFDTVGRFPSAPFDILLTARQDFPLAPNMATHLESFVMQIREADQLHNFVPQVVASSILLDQYPPGMHHFNPAEVYDKFYKNTCLQVARTAANKRFLEEEMFPNMFCNEILANLESLFKQLVDGQSAKSIHEAVLAKYIEEWRQIKSAQSCFICFSSDPQYVPQCGHAICGNCVQVFGQSEAPNPLMYRLRNCHGILCIDGGGVGGIIPSTILELIQDSLDLPIPIQEHFSMAYGVSVGGLVVLGLYEKGWSAATCTIKLETLATRAFHKPAYPFFLFFFMLKWIHLFLFGYLYSGEGIESALKEVFGDKKMTGPSYAASIGTKIGILTTSIVPPVTHLFTNYNGIGNERTGYIVPTGYDNVRTWEVARCTSAAPIRSLTDRRSQIVAHRPSLTSIQVFPDLQHPRTRGVPRWWCSIAEFSKLTTDATLDFLINLGTGSPSESHVIEKQKGLWPIGWLTRLVHAYLSFLNGRNAWNDVICLVKRTPKEKGCYRLDITLRGNVSLDDTASMPLLRSLAINDLGLQIVIRELAQRLFAALFYFELTAVPMRSGSRYRVSGQILCTRKVGDPALPLVTQRLSNYVLLVDGREMPMRPTSDSHGNVRIILELTTCQCINLELKESRSSQSFPLSGAPYTVSCLVAQGGLAATFGNRGHKRKAEDWSDRQRRRRRLQ
ncbi:hypothetical protein BX600DRAFT_526837 [Xylariales sp. PMI_506]|nr:hypothetical protein BX600DRAFT_526837 [Xylariales sp. PMI_506]